MAIRKLTRATLEKLRVFEKQLTDAVDSGEADRALGLVARIQELFSGDRRHHRLLRAKLQAFEACLDTNRLQYAGSGFLGIRRLAGKSTRLYLEASILLAVCHLRKKETPEAKQVIREVFKRINNIASSRTRREFQKKIVNRIEEESILASLIDTQNGSLDAKAIEKEAEQLAKETSASEIYSLIGNSLPGGGVYLLREVREYSLKQLTQPDRKLLPPPREVEEPQTIGRTAFAALKRVCWKTVCAKDSPVYKLWSKRVPIIFNQGYFSAAIITALGDFRIGIPLVASGLIALAMKYSAEEFCEVSRPEGIMSRTE